MKGQTTTNIHGLTPRNPVRKGSKIRFYGTEYKVNSIGSAKSDKYMDNVNVTHAVIDGKEITITLWWTEREGCEVIEF